MASHLTLAFVAFALGGAPKMEGPRVLADKFEYGNEVHVSCDSRTLAVVGYVSTVSLWDLRSARKQGVLIGEGVTTARFSSDGKYMACAYRDFDEERLRSSGRVIVFDVESRKQVASLGDLLSYVASIDFHPDGKTMIIVCSTHHPSVIGGDPEYTQELVVWSMASKSVKAKKRGRFSELGAFFAAGGKEVIAIDVRWNRELVGRSEPSDCNFVTFDDALKEKERRVRSKPIRSLALSGDGNMLATIGIREDTEIVIWDIAKGENRTKLPRIRKGSPRMTFGLSDRVIACVEDGLVIHFWDVRKRRMIGDLKGEGHFTRDNWCRSLAFSPDGQFLVTASRDGTVHIWRVKDYLEHLLKS